MADKDIYAEATESANVRIKFYTCLPKYGMHQQCSYDLWVNSAIVYVDSRIWLEKCE